MRYIKMITCTLVSIILIVGMTVTAYASSGSVRYTYSTTHSMWVAEEDNGLGTAVLLPFTVNAGTTFVYSKSDTQSRTFDQEEYWVKVDGNITDYYKNMLTFHMFDMVVYPEQATSKTCSFDYLPSYIISSNYIFFDITGSNTTLNILKKGNSYGWLLYTIGASDDINPITQSIYFNNLGGAVGTVGATTTPTAVPGDNDMIAEASTPIDTAELAQNIDLIKAKIEEDELQTETITLKENKKYVALMKYAEENNILVTDEEVDSYIEEIIHGCKSSEEGKVIGLACSEVGTTIEDVIRGDYIRYEAMLVEQKAYDYYSNNYIERNGLEASTISETVKKQIYMDWVQFKSQM